MMNDKETWLAQTMEKIHGWHSGGAPADYQGPHFGGPGHRGLSPAHDILRMLSGIKQFHDGVFRGYYWVNGVKVVVETATNQFGTPYDPMGWGHAVCAWMVHIFCDFFSSHSLPLPGTSFFQGIDSHAVRQFVQRDLYQHGITLRHLALQTIPPLLIEMAIRVYIWLRYRNSGLDVEAVEQKKYELLTVGHSICTSFNVGKVILLNDPSMLNMPEMMAFVRSIFKLALKEQFRTSSFQKAKRNLAELQREAKALEDQVGLDMVDPLTI